jgi:hypothetical protein
MYDLVVDLEVDVHGTGQTQHRTTTRISYQVSVISVSVWTQILSVYSLTTLTA